MKKPAIVLIALLMSFSTGLAGDDPESVTLEGKIVCAKCSLHEEGRTKCQNVLVVEDAGKMQNYYLADTEANKEFGEVCMAKKPVVVTGTVSEKDGQMWLAAAKIEPVKTEG
jgi:hypothetical protein